MLQYLHNDSLVCFLDDEPLPMKTQFHFPVAENKKKLSIFMPHKNMLKCYINLQYIYIYIYIYR